MFLRPDLHGEPVHYFCGHSLGLQPVAAKAYIDFELGKWSGQAVEGHFEEPNPWLHYHKFLKPGLAYLCGAEETEVVAYGSLTSNMHNLFATFYAPTKMRNKILAEDIGFPSDTFALQTQVSYHGFDPETSVVYLSHDQNYCFSTDYIIQQIEKHKDTLALIWLSAVNFLSGQVLDIRAIAAVAKRHNIKIGLDLAHAIGNIPLQLHDWEIDFAVWCSYKYLNAGPGATGGYFVHEKHFPQPATHNSQPETILGGWWGHEEKTRFQTNLTFRPINNADAWQHSNANVLSLAALRSSLDIFLTRDLKELTEERKVQTTKAFEILKEVKKLKILTPDQECGNMIAVQTTDQNKDVIAKLKARNIWVDWREPGIMRFSYCPLYNNALEWQQFIGSLHEML